MEYSLLFPLLTLILALATFFVGRLTVAKKDGRDDGERWARLEVTLEHFEKQVRKDLSEIKASIEKNESSTKESIRRLHERIDNHLEQQHHIKLKEQIG